MITDPAPGAKAGRRGLASGAPALLLLALTIASAASMRGLLSPIQEAAQHDLRLTDMQMSLVQGLAASIPIALLSIPLGRLVDRSNRVRLLIALAAISILGTLLAVVAKGFAVLFVARMLAALGAVGALPVAISIAADLTAPARRGRAMLFLSLGNTIGAAAAFALGGWLFGWLASRGAGAALFGLAPWRGAHLVFALFSGLAILPLFLLCEPPRHEVGEAPDAALAPVLRELWDRRAFLAPLFIGQIGAVMADTAAGIWAAPVLNRDYGLRPDQFAGWMGLVILVSGALGAVAGGVAADLGQKSPIRGGILIGAVAAATLSIPAAFFAIAPSVPAFAVLLAALLLAGAMMGLITATAIAVLVPNELRGVCLGAFVVIAGIVAFGLAPTLVTLVAGVLGGGGRLGQALALTDACVGAASLIGFALALKNTPPPPSHAPALSEQSQGAEQAA